MIGNLRSLKLRRQRLFIYCFLGLLVFGMTGFRPVPKLYRGEVRFIVGQDPLDSTTELEEERFYNWTTSEYIVAGISDWVNGTQFAEQVSDKLQAQGHDLDPFDVSEYVQAAYARSRLIVGVTHPEEDMVETIAFAAAETLLAPEEFGIPQFGTAAAAIFPIDKQIEVQRLNIESAFLAQLIPSSTTALLISVVIIGLVELFDPTIRTRSGAKALDLPLLGEIPK